MNTTYLKVTYDDGIVSAIPSIKQAIFDLFPLGHEAITDEIDLDDLLKRQRELCAAVLPSHLTSPEWDIFEAIKHAPKPELP